MVKPQNTHINWTTNFSLLLTLLSTFVALLLLNSPGAEGQTSKMYWTDKIRKKSSEQTLMEAVLLRILSPRWSFQR